MTPPHLRQVFGSGAIVYTRSRIGTQASKPFGIIKKLQKKDVPGTQLELLLCHPLADIGNCGFGALRAANEAECRIRYTEIHTEQPRVLMEVGHPAQNPAIGSACRAFAAVATPRESPSYNSQSVFFGAVARIVELGYWVKTAWQQQLSKHHHHHHHPCKQQQ